MGRALRTDVGDYVYHVLNCANARATICKKKADYERRSGSIARCNPYGSFKWTESIIKKFDLETTVRARGRPKKVPDTFFPSDIISCI